MYSNNNNNNNARSAFDLLKHEEEAKKLQKYVEYVDSYDCREEDKLLDHRYSFRFHLRGMSHPSFQGVIPVGSKRLQFIYNCSTNQYGNKVVGFPALSHRSHLGMTADMLDVHEINYKAASESVRDGQLKFSVMALAYRKQLTPFMAKCGNARAMHDFNKMCLCFDVSNNDFNRDTLAPIYAQVDMLMETYFGMNFRVTQTLDPIELLEYLKDLHEKGPRIMLRPRKIKLHKHLKVLDDDKDDDETGIPRDVNADDEDYYGSVVDDDSGDPDPGRILVLKKMGELKPKITLDEYIPKVAPAHECVEWHPPGAATIIIASLREHHVKLAMPDLADIPLDDWHKFAIHRFVYREFGKEKNYYVLIEDIEDEIRRLNASQTSERRLFPIRLNESSTRRIVSEMIAEKELHMDNPLGVERYYSRTAWYEERKIIDCITNLVNEPSPSQLKAPTLPEFKMILPRFTDVKLTDEQIEAVFSAVVKRVCLITGPGGSGKTVVLDVIQKMLRSMYPGEVFLFCSFKNGIIHTMRDKFGSGVRLLEEPPIHENEYRTLDKLIWSGFTGGSKYAPVCVFMEEAGQTCGEHMSALFKAIDLGKVRNFVVIGDGNQRAPIRAGIPFKSLLIALKKYGFVSKLTKVHRTDAQELRARQDAILDYKTNRVFMEGVDYSFRLRLEAPNANNRMSQWVMKQYAQIIYSELAAMKEQGIGCEDIMGICPYNDYCELANAVAANFLFDGPDYYTVIPELDPYERAKKGVKQRLPPFYAVGMRVVFNKTKKRSADDVKPGESIIEYARGQVGVITHIVDMEIPRKDQDPDDFCPYTTNIRNSIPPIPRGFRRAFKIKVGRAPYESSVQLDFNDMFSVRQKISPANFITGDRAQGEEYEHVIACFPWGNNLATNDVFYTICSRPKKSLCVVGARTHMEKMILTPPSFKNWKLDDDDVIKVGAHVVITRPKALPSAGIMLTLPWIEQTPVTETVDEFEDDTLDPDTIRAIDEAQHGFEQVHKKAKYEVFDIDDD